MLTGAFLPYAFKNSDTEFNIGMAIAGVQTLSDGIYVSLNGIIGKFNEIQQMKLQESTIKNHSIRSKNDLIIAHERINSYINYTLITFINA